MLNTGPIICLLTPYPDFHYTLLSGKLLTDNISDSKKRQIVDYNLEIKIIGKKI